MGAKTKTEANCQMQERGKSRSVAFMRDAFDVLVRTIPCLHTNILNSTHLRKILTLLNH